MSRVEWNTENLPMLGRVFLRKVLDNMREYEESTIRFGETGGGLQPNYQVTFPNKRCIALRGSSHKIYEQTDEFNTENISRTFTLSEVRAAYDRA